MKLQNLSYLMDRAVDMHKKYIKSIVLYQLAMAALSFVFIFIIVFFMLLLTFMGSTALTASNALSIITAAFIILATVMLTFTVTSLNSIGMMDMAKRDMQGLKVEMSKAFSFTFKNAFRVMGAVFSMVAAFLPLGLIWFAIGYGLFKIMPGGTTLSGIQYGTQHCPAYVIILICLYILAVIFSYFVFSTLYIFTIHAVVFQNKSFFRALAESRRLVRNNFWRILSCSILFRLSVWAIYGAVSSFFILLGSLLMYFLKFISAEKGLFEIILPVLNIMNWPMRILQQLFISPIYSLLVTLLYFNQRFRKDGWDLSLKLENLNLKKEERTVAGDKL